MIKFFIIFLVLAACGKSPFIDEHNDVQVTQNVQGLEAQIRLSSLQLTVGKQWIIPPVVSNESRLLLNFFNDQAQLIDFDGNLKVYLWMPSMGHGSFPVSIERIGRGVYQITDIFFTMPGDWDIHIEVEKDGIKVDEYIWSLVL